MDEQNQTASALPANHYHYMGWSMNGGYGTRVCITSECDFVDLHATVKDLSWLDILKYKFTKTPNREPDED